MVSAAQKKRHLGRRAFVGTVVLILLGLVVWFAPTLLVHSPFWARVLDSVGAPAGLHVATGHVALGWTAPIVLEDITVSDQDGVLLARIASVRSDHSLWALVTHRDDLGRIHLEKPHLNVSMRLDGSNLEDVVTRLVAQPQSSGTVRVELQIDNGSIAVQDATRPRNATGRNGNTVESTGLSVQAPPDPHGTTAQPTAASVQLDTINALVSLSPSNDSDGTATIKQCNIHGGKGTGRLAASFAWRSVDAALDWNVEVHSDNLPLSVVALVARRWSEDLELDGRLSGDLSVQRQAAAKQLDIRVSRAAADDLVVAASQLGSGATALHHATLSGEISASDRDWLARQIKFDCDAGHLLLDGHLPAPGGDDLASLPAWISSMTETSGELRAEGELDFAAMARIAPRLLRVRDDTTIESGGAQFRVTGTVGAQGSRLVGQLESRAISARRADRLITWDAPVILQIDARQEAGSWKLDKLVCRTEFLNVAGQADSKQGSADLRCDLDQLMTRLEQFIDIGEFRASGRSNGHVSWQKSSDHEYALDATGQMTDFVWNVASVQVREPVINLTLKGQWDSASGGGRFSDITLQTQSLATRGVDLTIVPEGEGHRIKGSVLFRTNLDQLRQGWQIASAPVNWRLHGDAQGQASFDHHAGVTAAQWSVQLDGAMLARKKSLRTGGTPSVTPVGSTAQWEPVWQEPEIKLSGQGHFGWNDVTAHFTELRITASEQLELAVAGAIAQPQGQCQVDLQGEVAYDLASLSQRARKITGVPLEVTGRDKQHFSIRGPLFDGAQAAAGLSSTTPRGLVPDQLVAECGLGWRAANYLGIVLGAGVVRAQLHDHIVETEPIELPISGGKLRLMPHIQLDQDQVVLTVDPGPILTDVEITRAMCAGWLMYVTPVAAGATSARGTFSVTLNRAVIPLGSPEAADVQGTISVADGQLGPGSTARIIMGVANNLKQVLRPDLSRTFAPEGAWLTIPPQQIRFHVHDGRVYHDGLEMRLGDIAIRTHGSVGLDQSLAVVAELPIQDGWIGTSRNLAVLKGQIVEVPLHGTLSAVRVDTRGLDGLAQRVLQNMASRTIERELNKGLKQLFGGGSR